MRQYLISYQKDTLDSLDEVESALVQRNRELQQRQAECADREAFYQYASAKLEEEIAALQRWLEEERSRPDAVEYRVTPVDAFSEQFLDLESSREAMNDALYQVERAFLSEAIPLNVMLKWVRLLSRQVFYKSASSRILLEQRTQTLQQGGAHSSFGM